MWLMRKLMKNTRPSGASTSTHISGLPNSVCPNGVSPTMAPEALVTTASLIGEPRDDAGQRDAARHVVVDADHMGAQAHVIGDRTIGAYAAQAGIVPVEIRHWIILSFARDSLGRQGGSRGTAALPGWREFNA